VGQWVRGCSSAKCKSPGYCPGPLLSLVLNYSGLGETPMQCISILDSIGYCFRGLTRGFVGESWRQPQKQEQIQGSLHCATDGESVRCFGRGRCLLVGISLEELSYFTGVVFTFESLTRAFSSLCWTLATSAGSASAGREWAYSVIERSHWATAIVSLPVFS
jgi:hypothetical protein